jgi:hypothetical protein
MTKITKIYSLRGAAVKMVREGGEGRFLAAFTLLSVKVLYSKYILSLCTSIGAHAPHGEESVPTIAEKFFRCAPP